eukprot:5893615-Amphidinium_carterae.1
MQWLDDRCSGRLPMLTLWRRSLRAYTARSLLKGPQFTLKWLKGRGLENRVQRSNFPENLLTA